MPVSAVLVTLEVDSPESGRAIHAFANRRELVIAHHQGPRVGLVADTSSSAADKALWDWLQGLPGVAHVDLLFAHFDDGEAPVPSEPNPQGDISNAFSAEPSDQRKARL